MKLKVFVDPPVDGIAFRPGENVLGRVELTWISKSGDVVPEVRVDFKGTTKLTLKPGLDAMANVAEMVQHDTVHLFSYYKLLQPKHTQDAEGNAYPDHCIAYFSFVFPYDARCRDSPGREPLPPSSHVVSVGVDALVAYTVTAVCRRPGRLSRLLHARLRQHRVLAFLPPRHVGDHGLTYSEAWMPADLPGEHDAGGRRSGNVFHTNAVNAANASAVATMTNKHRLPRNALPLYSPAITFRVFAPLPTVLVPGSVASLVLAVQTPDEMLPRPDRDEDTRTGGTKFFVRSLDVWLTRVTRGCAGHSVRRDHCCWHLGSFRADTPLRHRWVALQVGQSLIEEEVRRGGLQNPDRQPYSLIRVPTNVPVLPRVNTCAVIQQFSLEVVFGVSAGVQPNRLTGEKAQPSPHIAYTKVNVQVEIAEPPPKYPARVQ